MSNLIIQSGLTFTEKDVNDLFIRPIYMGTDIRLHSTLMTGVRGKKEINLIPQLEKITRKYEPTSSPSSKQLTITPKQIETFYCEAEIEQTGRVFTDSVFQFWHNSGVKQDNIAGTRTEELVMGFFANAVRKDMNRLAYFADYYAEDIDGSKIKTGVASKDYGSMYDGHWTRYINDFYSGLIPSSQRVALDTTTHLLTAPVAQVATTTLTGTSGTANIPVMGINYLATFTTDLTTSAANFKATHEVALLRRGIVVTSSGAGIIFTSQHKGVPISVSNAVNVSGNLAGTTAATTANVAAGALKADAAVDIFTKLVQSAMNINHKQIAKTSAEKLNNPIFVTSSIYYNYLNSLQIGYTTLLDPRKVLIDGLEYLTFMGHPIIEMPEWDVFINEDLQGRYPHRAIMAWKGNQFVGLDVDGDEKKYEYGYDIKTKMSILRTAYMMGTHYIHKEFIAAAY